jgi:hypothetical protein
MLLTWLESISLHNFDNMKEKKKSKEKKVIKTWPKSIQVSI